MSIDTAFLCEITEEGVCLLEYRGYDSLAAVPEEIACKPVVSLAPYVFSAHRNYHDRGHGDAFWWSPSAGRISEKEAQEVPKIKGEVLTELRLPAALKQVGAYGFYNCWNLKKLELYSTTLDWGPGVFTGCGAVEELLIHVDQSRKSCLKEILSELRQTLRVTYDGPEKARLIFSEFFEEAVENTPARILVTNTHGCGKEYRNAFVATQFQFREYDSLFSQIQIQEPEELVTELAMGRVRYPYELAENHCRQYLDYLTEHKDRAARKALENHDIDGLIWLTEHLSWDREELKNVIETAGRQGNQAAVSYLMNRTAGQGNVKRRRFEL